MSSSTAMRVIKETETDASTERKRKDILGHCMVSLDIQNATVDADEGSQLSCTVFQVNIKTAELHKKFVVEDSENWKNTLFEET